MSPLRIIGALVALCCLMVAPAMTVQAQGLGMLGGGSDPGAGTLLERDDVAAAAEASFSEALLARADTASATGASRDSAFRLGPYVEEAQRRYRLALSSTLDELHGDGVMTLAEVTDALPPVRREQLNLFTDIIEARSRGYAPPPVRDDFDGYWPYAREMGRYILFVRNDASDWWGLLGWSVGGLVIAALVSAALEFLAGRVDDSDHRGLHRSMRAIRIPLLLSAMTLGALIGMEAFWKPNEVAFWLRAGLGTLLAGFVFWAFWKVAEPLSGWIASVARRVTDADIGDNGRLIVVRVLRLLFIVILVLVVTRYVIGASLTGILAGLGVAGVVLWFLLQGLIENLAASFTLFGDRSIGVGDTVVVDGQWATVENIGFRATRFRTFEGHLITVPNSKLIGDAVENVSRRPTIRRRFHLGIGYDTPPDKIERAIEIVREAIESRSDRLDTDAGVHVVMQNFGASDLQLLVQYFSASTDYWEAQTLHDEINREILRGFADDGIDIPFPTQTTILRTEEGSPARMRLLDGEGDDQQDDRAANEDAARSA